MRVQDQWLTYLLLFLLPSIIRGVKHDNFWFLWCRLPVFRFVHLFADFQITGNCQLSSFDFPLSIFDFPSSTLDFLSSIFNRSSFFALPIFHCRLWNLYLPYTVEKCWRCRHTYSEVGIDHTLRQIPQSDPCLSGKPCMLTLYVLVKTVRLNKIGGVLVSLFLCSKRVQWFKTVRAIATGTNCTLFVSVGGPRIADQLLFVTVCFVVAGKTRC